MPRCFMSALAKLGGSQEEEKEEDQANLGQRQERGLWLPVQDCLHRNINIDIDTIDTIDILIQDID